MKRSHALKRERDLERILCDRVEEMGGHAYKFSSPGRKNVPDRICVFPSGHVVFVEVKAPGKSPTTAQERELNRLAELNQWVFAINDEAGLRKVLDKMKEVMGSD